MPFIVYEGNEETPEQVAVAFAGLGHKLAGEVEVVWGEMCCSGYWYMLRCESCNWFWSFNPFVTHEFEGPDHLPLTCLGHHQAPPNPKETP